MKKSDKLPKRFWIKGKSKFFIPRLIEEGIIIDDTDLANAWWVVGNKESAMNVLIKKLT